MERVTEFFTTYRNHVYIAGLAIVIIVVLYLLYRQKRVVVVQPEMEAPTEAEPQGIPQDVPQGQELDGGGSGSQEPVKVVLFFAPWCSHCKHLKDGPDSVWEKLKQKLGHRVKFEEVNCDEKPEMATQFGIKGFPTVLKFKKDKVEEFGGERTLEVMEEFVNSD